MGIFSAIKQRAANKALARANQQYGQELANWTKDSVAIEEMLTVVRDCAAGKARDHFVDNGDYGFMLNPTEIPVAYLPLALYYEADETHDEGSAIITTERVLYAGALATREWVFKKLINITHSPAGYSVFATTGVGTPGGIAYGPDVAMEVQFRIELGAAIARDRLPQFLSELDTTLATHNTQMPVPPPPSASTTA
jgi:hypothetical protein